RLRSAILSWCLRWPGTRELVLYVHQGRLRRGILRVGRQWRAVVHEPLPTSQVHSREPQAQEGSRYRTAVNAVSTRDNANDDTAGISEWLVNHLDYLPIEIMGQAPIPCYGVRMVISVGANGQPAVSFAIDNADSLNRFELAGALDML